MSQAVQRTDLTPEQMEMFSEGYMYDNDEDMPMEPNDAYTADIHVYNTISNGTSTSRAQRDKT